MDRILIIEDDPEVNRLLCDLLYQNKYKPIPAYNGLEAVKMFDKNDIQLILLDLMLPDLNGEEILTNIRLFSKVPIIIVSAKNNIEEKVQILRNGADDYITKPFHMEEIIVRIECCLRRFRNESALPNKIQFKDILMDTELKSVSINGSPLNLTAKEYNLLEILLSNPHKTFSKKQLFEIGWKEKYIYNDDVINTHISNLRKKLNMSGKEHEYIETVFGIGYKLYI